MVSLEQPQGLRPLAHLACPLQVSWYLSSHRYGLALKLLFMYQTAYVMRGREEGRLANRETLGICTPFLAHPGVA